MNEPEVNFRLIIVQPTTLPRFGWPVIKICAYRSEAGIDSTLCNDCIAM
jgi:hypothetical protein